MRQFLSYVVVGGAAAIVEWSAFFIGSTIARIPYHVSTVFSFLAGTFANLMLGKRATFKNCRKYEGRRFKEGIDVFAASAAGLLMNLALMRVFVGVLGCDTGLLINLSKVMATGIVFVWNYFVRKLVVYRDKPVE